MSEVFELRAREDDFDDVQETHSLSDIAMIVAIKGISCLAVAPFENSKVLLQVQNSSATGALVPIPAEQLKTAGPVVGDATNQINLMRVLNSDYLYRGTVTKVVEEVCRTLVTQSIAHSLYTPALEEMPVYYQGQTIAVLVPDDDPLAPASMLATGVAGAIGGVLLNPIEVIHTRMVLQRNVSDAKYQNILQGLALVYDEEGLEGLFAGWQLAAIAHGVLPVLSDIGDSLLAELFEGVYGDDGVSSVGYVLCDILYNLAVLQIQMPLEVMRRRLYVQGALKHGFHPVTKVTRTAYTSTADIATRIYAEEGVSTFFSGFATHFAAATGAIVLYIGLQLAGE